MKKTLILYLVIVILFVMTGCDNEKTSNQEVNEWDSTYTCGELKLSLKKLDTLVEQYSILLKTKDCKYSNWSEWSTKNHKTNDNRERNI